MKTVAPACLCVVLLASLAACRPASAPGADAREPLRLDTEKARASYMVGVDAARGAASVRDRIDPEIAARAMRDTLSGRPLLMDEAALASTRQAFTAQLREQRMAERKALGDANLAAGRVFLAANAGKPGVHRTASGLQYQVLREGQGPRPTAADTVRVHYVGRLLDGREFENTRKLDHDASFPLGQIMPGWREGLVLMPVGGRYLFWMPPSLAYGERGVPGTIGPNETLVFDIELLEIAQP